ncbi:MAG: selenide, water dikinase SelD [Candidatus Krumholzibacteriota bacterium]|nr:selenide, water dikinase SelD [Candidatus Krumholzibacteriota bacterium]
MGPGDLARALCGLDLIEDPNLIVGFDTADDAGVYRLSDERALIQTVDFFTPIVDDPYLFGRIAAANALSDVYAMGGRPLCAMNIAGFPVKTMDIEVLRQILRGGLDTLREAGAALAGGHTVEDPELKYGMAVSGLVHPGRVLTNRGARAGDALVLTKPLGTGVVNTALKRGCAREADVAAAVAAMTTLNRRAAELLAQAEVHACTDVTGFGLGGHLGEMIEGADVGAVLRAGALPLLPGARDYASRGLLPGGLHRNREFRAGMTDIADGVPADLANLLFDPQTSGGLLVAVPGPQAEDLAAALRAGGVPDAAVVGEIVAKPAGRLVVRR